MNAHAQAQLPLVLQLAGPRRRRRSSQLVDQLIRSSHRRWVPARSKFDMARGRWVTARSGRNLTTMFIICLQNNIELFTNLRPGRNARARNKCSIFGTKKGRLLVPFSHYSDFGKSVPHIIKTTTTTFTLYFDCVNVGI